MKLVTKPSPQTYKLLRKIHKFSGLTAAVWLLIVATTGILLDHHEWRWLSQTSVNNELMSDQMQRLTPATVMRHISSDGQSIIGGSERGTWYSRDSGNTWVAIKFKGLTGQPQLFDMAQIDSGGITQTYLATDDGLWKLDSSVMMASRLAWQNNAITSLSEGSIPGTLLAVRNHSDLLGYDLASTDVISYDLSARYLGKLAPLEVGRLVMDIHFGRALPGSWGPLVNDIGGVAMAVLSLTGLAYWWITRSGRRRGISMKTQRGAIRWLFRSHAPIIGVIGAIPILYLSITAIPLNHIYGFLSWADEKVVSAALTPPVYSKLHLEGEIQDAVAWPGDADRLLIATRLGVFETRDRGVNWSESSVQALATGFNGAYLTRRGEWIFAGYSENKNYALNMQQENWVKLKNMPSALTSAAQTSNGWLFKTSRGIFASNAVNGRLNDSGIAFRHAAPGTTIFLLIADIHTGLTIHKEFKWMSDLFAVLAILLVISGPLMWLRRKWV